MALSQFTFTHSQCPRHTLAHAEVGYSQLLWKCKFPSSHTPHGDGNLSAMVCVPSCSLRSANPCFSEKISWKFTYKHLRSKILLIVSYVVNPVACRQAFCGVHWEGLGLEVGLDLDRATIGSVRSGLTG